MLDLLVEDRNAGERTRVPLGVVGSKLWINRLQEWTHEWDLEHRASDVALSPNIHD